MIFYPSLVSGGHISETHPLPHLVWRHILQFYTYKLFN